LHSDTVSIPGIPYQFSDRGLLEQALTHRSLERKNNERLEFLGDSILNFVVSARLYELNPAHDEGDLSRLRARVVRGETLAKIAAGLDLGRYLRLGEGELKSGGYKRKSILADALEAIYGAIYLDGGFEPCADVILKHCGAVIAALPDAQELKDPKTRLQEWLQGHGHELPTYTLISEEGLQHKKRFRVRCSAAAETVAVSGEGRSRQKAEQAAAEAALRQILEQHGK
jgi:ribonuclease-3